MGQRVGGFIGHYEDINFYSEWNGEHCKVLSTEEVGSGCFLEERLKVEVIETGRKFR